MIRQVLRFLLSAVILTTVFTNCFCQYDPWTVNKTHKDLRLKGRVDSCVTNIIVMSYKDGATKKQLNAKIVEYYNKHGEVIKMYHYILGHNPDTADAWKNPSITVYKYDKTGGFEKTVDYKSKTFSKDVFTYTNDKTVGYLKHYVLPDNKLAGMTKLKLNTRGDIEESVYYSRDTSYNAKPYWKINYEYNQNGYLLKDSTSNSSSTRIHRNFYTYDQNNNLIKILRTADPQPSIEVYTYPKFDKLHNWLEADMFSEGKLIYVIERQVTYYK
jgi:hypothetical protein